MNHSHARNLPTCAVELGWFNLVIRNLNRWHSSSECSRVAWRADASECTGHETAGRVHSIRMIEGGKSASSDSNLHAIDVATKLETFLDGLRIGMMMQKSKLFD